MYPLGIAWVEKSGLCMTGAGGGFKIKGIGDVSRNGNSLKRPSKTSHFDEE